MSSGPTMSLGTVAIAAERARINAAYQEGRLEDIPGGRLGGSPISGGMPSASRPWSWPWRVSS